MRPPVGRAAWAAPTRRRRATACRGEAALPQGHRQGLRLGGSSCSLFASKAGVASTPPFSLKYTAVHELRGANRASSRRADDVEASTPKHKARPLRRHYYFLFFPPPPRGGGQQPQQQQRKQLRSARARRRGGRSPALRAGAGAEQADYGESERAVSGQCVWRGAQRPTRRPRSACLCPALLRENNQQQTEIGAY